MRRTFLLLAVLLQAACGRGVPSRAYDVRTPDGSPLQLSSLAEEVTLVAREPRTGAARELALTSLSELSGPLVLDGVAEDETLELWVRGYRPLSVPIPAPRHPLVLKPGIAVRLRVESKAPLPSDGDELRFEFLWRGSGELPEAPTLQAFEGVTPEGWKPSGEDDEGRADIVVTAENPEAALRVSFPGRYRVTWGLFAVRRAEGSSSARGILLPDAGGNVVVAEVGAEPQVLTLRIPEVQLQQAYASLRR